jgi:hypothetical protein
MPKKCVEFICKCQNPANPDKCLIGCTNSKCEKWMHKECMTHDILMQVFERLGTDEPHQTEESTVKGEKPTRRSTRKPKPSTARSTSSISIATASRQGSARKGLKKGTADCKPYLGLFEANLNMQEVPTRWEIRDLRENVTGGDKMWTEEPHCLLCRSCIE